jgi:signal transduction histidine kinase
MSGDPVTLMWLIRDAAERASDIQAWRTARDRLHRDVEERELILKDLGQSIADRLAGIRKLSRRVMELQDFEGQKLARELRERFGQTLGAVKLNLESLAKSHGELRTAPLHREALKLVDAALQRLREIYFELSPPLAQGIGLSGMIRQVLARVPEPEHLKTSLEADALPLISPQVESAALWVAREAINNTVRHSGASSLEVRIEREGNRLVMLIRDNGRGFNVAATRALAERAGCFGLVGMEERVAILGGDIQIISTPRHGTEVRVMFPAAARE